MKLDEITIILGDGTKIELSSAFVGGIMNDLTKAPMGLFSGHMNIETAGTSLIHLLRAAIKLCHEELEMPLHVYASFLHFCMETAIEKELKNDIDDNRTLEEHEIYLKLKQDKTE
jgi:hypothetical protein